MTTHHFEFDTASHKMAFNRLKDVGRGHGQDGDDSNSDSDHDQEGENEPLIPEAQPQNSTCGKSTKATCTSTNG